MYKLILNKTETYGYKGTLFKGDNVIQTYQEITGFEIIHKVSELIGCGNFQ